MGILIWLLLLSIWPIHCAPWASKIVTLNAVNYSQKSKSVLDLFSLPGAFDMDLCSICFWLCDRKIKVSAFFAYSKASCRKFVLWRGWWGRDAKQLLLYSYQPQRSTFSLHYSLLTACLALNFLRDHPRKFGRYSRYFFLPPTFR